MLLTRKITTKKLWQLTHTDLATGHLAQTRCPKCGGTGRCTQLVLHIDQDNQLQEQNLHLDCDCRERAAELLAEANAPPGRLETAALGDLDWPAIRPPKARSAIQLYAERLDNVLASGVGLILTGDVGTGKTHIALGLVRLACSLGIQARFVTMSDLLESLKATYDRDPRREGRSAPPGEAHLLAGLAELPLLALDDLGTENPTPWAKERLYTLVNRRYLARRPIIVTANERPAALARRLGQRIMSRLRGTSVEAHLTGPDHRLATRDHVLDELHLGWAEQWARTR